MLQIKELAENEVERISAVLGLARLRQGNGHDLVAWEDDEPVGHAHLALTDPPELQDVSVRPEYRRRGVATALAAAAERAVVAEKGRRLRLSVSVDNEALAPALEEDLGSATSGCRPDGCTAPSRSAPVPWRSTTLSSPGRSRSRESHGPAERSQTVDQTNLDIYGHPPIPWSRAKRRLGGRRSEQRFSSRRVRPDGRPHVAGVGALWEDRKFYIVSSAGTRKSKTSPSGRLRHFRHAARPRPRRRGHGAQGDRRRDPPAPRRAVRRAGLAGDGKGRRVHRSLQRPERRATPWDLYEFTPTIAFGVATPSRGGTRWRF